MNEENNVYLASLDASKASDRDICVNHFRLYSETICFTRIPYVLGQIHYWHVII